DLSFEVDLEPAGFAVVDELEAIDIPSIVDDFEHRADRVRGGLHSQVELADASGVVETAECVGERVVVGHWYFSHPMPRAISRKHCRQSQMLYLPTKPCLRPQRWQDSN